MIKYYWGSDREGGREMSRATLATQRKMSKSSPVFEFAGDDVNLDNLRELIYARPFIGDRVIVFLDHLALNSAMSNFVIENLSVLHSSANVFIFWEDETGVAMAKAISKLGDEVREFKETGHFKQEEEKTKLTKLFAVADALGSRDRKRAWLLYHEARRAGLATEEIFWKLVWKVKTLLMVETAPVGSILPLKPYPLSQARQQIKGYKPGELSHLSSRLVHLYHDSRRGLLDFDFSLEQLLLEL